MTRSGTALERLREWGFDHPRAKTYLREAWAIARVAAREAHLPPPFTPPEWRDFARLNTGARTSAEGSAVLILSTRGWSTHLAWETLLGRALVQRGCRVSYATCGGRLPVCDIVPITSTGSSMPCRSCREYVGGALNAAGFSPLEVRDLIDVKRELAHASSVVAMLKSVAQCEAFESEDLPLGRIVRISLAWYLSRGTLQDDDETLRAYKRFLVTGLIYQRAFSRLLDKERPDRVFTLSGVFAPERILSELAWRRGIRVARYEKGFLNNSLVISTWNPGSDLLDVGQGTWDDCSTTKLSNGQRQWITGYLADRVAGGQMFDAFWRTDNPAVVDIRRTLRFDDTTPLVAAFTNTLWDGSTQGLDVAFRSMADWVVETIEWGRRSPKLNVAIRIHPADVMLRHHPAREVIQEHIALTIPDMPANVRIIGPKDPLNSYGLAMAADVGLTYTSTIGLEMAALGKPVVVAGRPHYSRKGFTNDPDNAANYWREVEKLLSDPDPDDRISARRDLALAYGYLFFYRFHQHLSAVEELGRSRPRLGIREPHDLDAGRDPVIDRIVDHIIRGDGPLIAPPGD